MLLFACVAWGAGAQGIARVRGSLAAISPASGASVEVTETADAAAAIAGCDKNGRTLKVPCYRVGLFLGNSQSARADADAVVSSFAETFPEVSVQVTYESPYFKVVAGNYVSHIDAVALRGKALAQFPKAVVVKDEIAVASVVSRRGIDAFVPSSLSSEASDDENIEKKVEN